MHTPKTKIAILGAGSIGCYLGGLLASQGLEVLFFGREKLKQATQDHGLTLTHFSHPDIKIAPRDIAVETTPNRLSECEIILICTKSQDTAFAAAEINEFALPTCHVISCQNGVANVSILRDNLKSDQHSVIGTIVPFNVTPSGPGRFHCGTDGPLHFSQQLPSFIEQAFEATGQAVLSGGNFEGDQWAKLIVNLNNGLNALSGTTLHNSLMQRSYRKALHLCLSEAINIVELSGVSVGQFNGRSPKSLLRTLSLPNWIYKIVMQKIVKIDAKARSSMLDDLEAGRPSEINFLQGEIVRKAQKLNHQAPYNQTILDAVETAFERGVSPTLSGKEILGLLRR